VTVYRYISAERAHCHPVSLMYELLGVSESGYWAWVKRPPSDRELSDAWLTECIRAVRDASSGRYGSPRVHAVLRRQGIGVGEKRVARLMALAGLQGTHQRRRRKGGTTRVEGVEPFGDLVGRDFRPDAPYGARREALAVSARATDPGLTSQGRTEPASERAASSL
jgi:putative transposase